MNCPTCNKPMRKVRMEITNNGKPGKEFTEYEKLTYQCKGDDVWGNTEIPLAKNSSNTSP